MLSPASRRLTYSLAFLYALLGFALLSWPDSMASVFTWALLNHAYASYGLIVAITAAALWNLRLFDFAEHPGGLLYIGAYLVVGLPLLAAFYRLGTGLRPD